MGTARRPNSRPIVVEFAESSRKGVLCVPRTKVVGTSTTVKLVDASRERNASIETRK